MSNPTFGGAAPGGSARLSEQQVWQHIGEVAGQMHSLVSLHTTLHDALCVSLGSTVMRSGSRDCDYDQGVAGQIRK